MSKDLMSGLDDLDKREYQDNKNEDFNHSLGENLDNSSEISKADTKTKKTSLGKAGGYDEINDEMTYAPGYVEVYKENFPSKGLFYERDAKFLIKAASVADIKAFSIMDENDPFSIDETLNQILRSCLTYRAGKSLRSYKDLKEEDRVYIILAIRELTFVNGENSLTSNVTCTECDYNNNFVISKESFESTEPSDKIMKYYDEVQRKFIVNSKVGTFEIEPPSIGIMNEITKYVQKIQQEGRKLDRAFIKVLPYMVSEWRGFGEKTINNLQMDFMSWNATEFGVINALTDMAKVGVKETMTNNCEKCQSEVTSPISFPDGIKSLFVISDIDSQLL